MTTADEILDSVLLRIAAGEDPKQVFAGADREELGRAALERLKDAALGGWPLLVALIAVRHVATPALADALRDVVLSPAAPRHFRARAAEVLCRIDRDALQQALTEVEDDDCTLGFEGLFERDCAQCLLGARTPEDLADLLREMPEWAVDYALPRVEEVRARTGLPASEAYAEVVLDAALEEFWPSAAAALAAEGSAEALALLDRARKQEDEDVEPFADAWKQLVIARSEGKTDEPLSGEAWLSNLDAQGEAWGMLTLGAGATRTLFMIAFSPGAFVDVGSPRRAPVEMAEVLRTRPTENALVAVPLLEAAALLARAAEAEVRGGTAEDRAEFVRLLRAAPPLAPLPDAEPLTAEEADEVLDAGPLAGWPVDAALPTAAQAALELLEESGDRPALAQLTAQLDYAARHCRWTQRTELGERLAASARRLVEGEETPFLIALLARLSERLDQLVKPTLQ